MLSEALEQAYNDQIAMEFGAAYKYIGIAAYFDSEDLPGFSHWMEMQHHEEIEHAHKFYRFVLDREGTVRLGSIPSATSEYESAEAAVAAALASERAVTAAINAIFARAQEEDDFASFPLLQWFVEEQVEEEASVGELLAQVRRASTNPAALLMLDRELAGRTSED